MANVFEPQRFVNDFMRAMNSKDPSKLLTYYAEDAEIVDPSTPEPLRGKAGIERNFEQWSGAFSEVKFDVQDVVSSGGKVALRIGATARHTGTLDLGQGQTLPPSNRIVHMEVAEFLTLDQRGAIKRDETIFDVAGMLEQMKSPVPAR